MRSLSVRVTISHLLVSLGALGLLALLSPFFFRTYYARSEVRRVNAAVTGLSRAATGLLKPDSASPALHTLVRNSANVLGGEVLIMRATDGAVLATSGRHAGPTSDKHLELSRPVAENILLVVRLPLTGLDYMMRAQRAATLVTAGLAALLAIALAVTVSRAISAPLVAMSQAAGRRANEDFTARVEERGPEEVVSLARSLNHMAGALEVAFNEMQRLDLLRREFVGNASHELRAPLTNIRGFLDAILDGTAASPAEQTHCLQTASSEARRMTRIVEELLQLSRLQAGVLEFDLAAQDLQEIVASIADTFAPRLRERDVRLEIQAETVSEVQVDGDKIAQVLVNLLDNALRYSPAGGTITVTLRGEPGRVRLAVADQGPGIPGKDLAEIWERFHKADPARPRTQPGAGLGLAIAREIIKRHRGEVFARNREEKGAEVGFWLPGQS
ncbi:MAG: ATP-binding protein [Armatimonadota bacterium]